ncbi:MAG: hypothetical protein H0W76_26185, partial [Pyrinomonadaceae bacterium]|nr:hypothetical protein [Pyrinomonadaceae bacterium]
MIETATCRDPVQGSRHSSCKDRALRQAGSAPVAGAQTILKPHHRRDTVNIALTLRNWLVGYHIFEYEQNGQDRAAYGEKLLENLSKDLKKLGKGFARRNLFMFREFYRRYPI